MGKLKIGFVLDDTLDTPDGVQQYILTLGKWLGLQGHDVHYLVGNTTRTDIPNIHALSRNVHVQFNGNRMSTPLPASKRAIKALVSREKFDVLHIQMPYSPFMAQRIIMAAPESTVLVGTFHIAPGSALVTMANKALGLVTRRSLQRFDSIMSVSVTAEDFARKSYNLETTILPNVVNTEPFRTAIPFTTPGGRITIVFVGRLVPRKGCRILLEAVNALHRDDYMPGLRVIICGRGPLEAELKSYVRANQLDEVVEFTGFISEENKARYLRTADIAVFPSTVGESFGIVLIEAMAAEHPVVLGADNEGYKTVLAPYPDVLFPVQNPSALAAKLKTFILDDRERRAALAWQRRYVQQFDVAVVGRRLVARYQEMLRRKSNVR